MNIVTRDHLLGFISALFIFLFAYTAINKIIDHDRFVIVLGKSSYLSSLSVMISWMVPFLELLAVILLLIPGFRRAGLVLSLALMAAFTLYITLMLLFESHLPCSCGGVISKMSWQQHLWFNIFFLLLAGAGLWIHDPKRFVATNRPSRKPV